MAYLGSWAADFLVAVSILFVFLYFYITSGFTTWKRKKVPYIEPTFPFGNLQRSMTTKVTFVGEFDEFYRRFKSHGFGGIYVFHKPVLIVCNLDLIKNFITKDFNSFHVRGVPHDEKRDPFSANLLSLDGPRWKVLRAKMSPTFSSGKIKGMMPLIQECIEELRECLKEEIKKKNGSVEMKDLLIRFATDVIGTCAFGMKCNSLKNSNTEFYNLSRDVFRRNVRNFFRNTLTTLFPKLASVLTMKLLFPKSVKFFEDLIASTVKMRREHNIERNDFVQLMMKIVDDDSVAFDQSIMAPMAFLFFLAGLDNIAQNIGICLHFLALDPDLQDKVYQEIRDVLNQHNDEMSYEAVGKMDLVARVIDEGLRLYTPPGLIFRVQTDDKYVIPGTDIEIEKGTSIWIPTQAIHRDPEYFPNPDKFDPDRFTEEEKAKRHPYAYTPFGEGPRFCIAARFALLEMRLTFAELVRHFKFGVAPETDLSLEPDPQSLGPSPKNGLWLTVSERSHE